MYVNLNSWYLPISKQVQTQLMIVEVFFSNLGPQILKAKSFAIQQSSLQKEHALMSLKISLMVSSTTQCAILVPKMSEVLSVEQPLCALSDAFWAASCSF
jgi:hypothetical protein